MREVLRRLLNPFLTSGIAMFLLSGTGIVNAQVDIPGGALDYDAPALPPVLWPTMTMIVDQALLSGKALVEKGETVGLPYRFAVNSEYKNTEGAFGELNLGGGNTREISYDGDVYSLSVDFGVKRERVSLGVTGWYEDFELDSYDMSRYGIAPYGAWTAPVHPMIAVNLLGTLYYFKNDVDSKLAPRRFSDYDSAGLSVSAALHFDSHQVHKAVTVDSGTLADKLALIGSVAVSYQFNDDDADRERVYNAMKVDEVDKQAQLLVSGNIGVRAGKKTVLMLSGVYGNDLSDYQGPLREADDRYSRLSLLMTHNVAPRWQVKMSYNQVFSDDVEYTGLYLGASKRY